MVLKKAIFKNFEKRKQAAEVMSAGIEGSKRIWRIVLFRAIYSFLCF